MSRRSGSKLAAGALGGAALTLSLVTLLVWENPATGAPAPSASTATGGEARLLRSARFWQVRGRPELARAALQRVLAAKPDHAEALLELGLLEISAGRFDEAQKIVGKLRGVQGQDRRARELSDTIRVATTERLRMANIRRQLQLSQIDSALQGFRELFPDGDPPGDPGLEYYAALARSKNGWDAAKAGVLKLAAEHSDDPHYRLALARLLAQREATRMQAVQMLRELAQRPDSARLPTRDAWRSAVLDLPAGPARSEQMRAYLLLSPDDAELIAALADKRMPSLAVVPAHAHPTAPSAAQRQALQWRSAEKTARAAGNGPRAQAFAEAADGFESGNLYRVAMAARERMQAGDRESGEALYRQVLSLQPGHETATSDLALWLDSAGRPAEASSLIAEARARQPAAAAVYDGIEAALLNARADRAADAALIDEAQALYGQALQLAPADPWLRFRLARLEVRRGRADRARELMAEGARRYPADADHHYSQALLLSSLGEDEAALQSMQRITGADSLSDSQRRFIAELQSRIWLAEAERLRNAGQLAAAQQQVELAEAAAEDDPDQLHDIARYWIAAEQPAQARSVFDHRVAESQSPSTALLLAWADVLSRLGDAEGLTAALSRIEQRNPEPAEERSRLSELQLALGLTRARARLQRHDADGALLALAEPLRLAPGNADAVQLQADALMAAGHREDAQAAYRDAVALHPDDVELRLGQAGLLARLHRNDESAAALDTLDQRLPAEALGERLRLARAYDSAGAHASADRVIALLREHHPREPKVLAQAGDFANDRQHYELAQQLYAKARALAAAQPPAVGGGTLSSLDRSLQKLEDRRQILVSVGANALEKPGDPGISDYSLRQTPVEWSWPHNFAGRLFLQLDPVMIDSGRLPANFKAAALYGQVQAQGPASVASFAGGAPQNQSGVAMGTGYSGDRWHADVGVTPHAFKKQSVVGGLERRGSIGRFDYGLELARRAVTSSLVSYAGAADPVTGQVWGGVTSTGLNLRLGRWEENRSLSGGISTARYTGTNVLDNKGLQLRLAMDWKLAKNALGRLDGGVVLNHWRYAENERYYSFGHGGYYSPQRYWSINLPLDFRGQRGPFSYRLTASWSYSRNQQKTMPFYPTRDDLQLRAASQPLPGNYQRPYYEGGKGHGTGYSATAAVEYALLPGWFIGGRIGIDRSDYYEPNQYSLYLRRPIGGDERRLLTNPAGPSPYPEY